MNIPDLNTKSNINPPQLRKTLNFKASPALSSLFTLMNKHEILGVSAVDLGSMVIPRTAVDFTRNPAAGVETGLREASSTVIHASIGMAGYAAAAFLSTFLKNKKYNVNFKEITADSDTIDILSKSFKNILTQNPNAEKKELAEKFLTCIFSDVKGLGGNSNIKNSQLWYNLKADSQTQIIKKLSEEISSSKSFSLNPKTLNILQAKMNFDIPSLNQIHANIGGKELRTKGANLINDAYSLTKAFLQDNVLATFKKSKEKLPEFSKDLKKLGIGKTILGLTAILAVSLSFQSINAYITKKRTGKSSFVGNPDFAENNKSSNIQKNKKELLPYKLLSILGMGYFVYKTLNANSLKSFFQKIQFKSKLPTVNQIKLVYGSTIIGRLLAARDKNELKESAFRDFLGFSNFLVLGSLVTKLFVNAKDKSLINFDSSIHGKGFYNWLRNSDIKTHEDVINSALKLNVLSQKGVKKIKDLYSSGLITQGSSIDKKLKVLNSAKLIGLLYSCIALGILVPIINKKMTEHRYKKNKQNNTFSGSAPVNTPEELKKREIIVNFLNRNI